MCVVCGAGRDRVFNPLNLFLAGATHLLDVAESSNGETGVSLEFTPVCLDTATWWEGRHAQDREYHKTRRAQSEFPIRVFGFARSSPRSRGRGVLSRSRSSSTSRTQYAKPTRRSGQRWRIRVDSARGTSLIRSPPTCGDLAPRSRPTNAGAPRPRTARNQTTTSTSHPQGLRPITHLREFPHLTSTAPQPPGPFHAAFFSLKSDRPTRSSLAASSG